MTDGAIIIFIDPNKI